MSSRSIFNSGDLRAYHNTSPLRKLSNTFLLPELSSVFSLLPLPFGFYKMFSSPPFLLSLKHAENFKSDPLTSCFPFNHAPLPSDASSRKSLQIKDDGPCFLSLIRDVHAFYLASPTDSARLRVHNQEYPHIDYLFNTRCLQPMLITEVVNLSPLL